MLIRHQTELERHRAELESMRVRVTICIAAVCMVQINVKRIVTCTDWLTSSDLGSSDSFLKSRYLPKGFKVLTSGKESEILSLMLLMRRAFAEAPALDETNIKPVIESALLAKKKEQIEGLLRDRIGLSYDVFLKHGKDYLSPDLLREIQYEITSLTVDAEFVICGFADGEPFLVETDRHYHAFLREDYAAVGSGSVVASASLLSRNQNYGCGLEETLYQVYEAKRLAESVRTVGKLTSLTVIYSDGREDETVTEDGERHFARLFYKYGPQPVGGVALTDGMLLPILKHPKPGAGDSK